MQKFVPHRTYSIAVRVIEIIKTLIYFPLILRNKYFSHVVNFVFPKAQSNFATAFTLYTLFFLGWTTRQFQSHVIYLWVVSTSININIYLFEHHTVRYVCSFLRDILTKLAQDSQCYQSVISRQANNDSFCPCNVQCKETNYELHTSDSKWPSNQYTVSYFNNIQ